MPRNPTAYGVLRQSFESVNEYRLYQTGNNKDLFDQIWLWHERLGNQPEAIVMPGICSVCVRQTNFTSTPERSIDNSPFDYRVGWWAQSNCACGLSNLERAALHILAEERVGHLYHVGHFSDFRRFLSQRYTNVTSSQYEEGRSSGEIVGDVRYEDMTRLSFENDSFDEVICMEILEHLPFYMDGIRELARVTRPDGRVFLSFPWLGRDTYDHLIRAEQQEDGSIRHHHSPEYHGDPARSEGILSFRSFGWQILDDLRGAGFQSASAEFIFGPVHGFNTLLNPIIVARK